MSARRLYDRWVEIGGKFSRPDTPAKKIARLARSRGALDVQVGKPGMVFWYHAQFRADPVEMRNVEHAWGTAGWKSHRRMPRGAYRMFSKKRSARPESAKAVEI